MQHPQEAVSREDPGIKGAHRIVAAVEPEKAPKLGEEVRLQLGDLVVRDVQILQLALKKDKATVVKKNQAQGPFLEGRVDPVFLFFWLLSQDRSRPLPAT